GFFKISRSCRSRSFSRFNWRISSSWGVWCPLPGKACSPCSLNCLHQWCSVLSARPKSLAIWACDLLLDWTSWTASTLNSLVNVRCSFCMIFSLPVSGPLVQVYLPHFSGSRPSVAETLMINGHHYFILNGTNGGKR